MYQNLIKNIKNILASKSEQKEKLLKIQTLVDFAEGIPDIAPRPQPQPVQQPQPQPIQQPAPDPAPEPKPPIVDGKKVNGSGALMGVEDIKK